MRAGSTSTHSATPPFIVTASGWAPPMPPSPPVSVDRAGERAAEVLVGALGERLVRALQDALGPDVDPRPGGHLPVHREALGLQRAERLPVGPLRHEHRVRDQHARRQVVRPEDRDRLARLHQQGLVVGERPQRAHDRVVGLPAAGGAAGAPVHDQVLGALGDLGSRLFMSIRIAASCGHERHDSSLPRGARISRTVIVGHLRSFGAMLLRRRRGAGPRRGRGTGCLGCLRHDRGPGSVPSDGRRNFPLRSRWRERARPRRSAC